MLGGRHRVVPLAAGEAGAAADDARAFGSLRLPKGGGLLDLASGAGGGGGRWWVDPKDPRLAWWATLVHALALLQLFSVPYRAAFGYMDRPWLWFLLLDLPTDLVFLLDLARGFVTSFEVDGRKVTDPRMMRARYLAGDFLGDAVAAAPVDVLLELAMGRWEPLSRALKLVKVRAPLRGLATMDRDPSRSLALVVGLRTLCYTLALSHVIGCGWFAFLRYGSEPDASVFVPTPDLRSRGLASQYLAALYFAMATMKGISVQQTTQGDLPVTAAEGAFACVAVIAGMLLLAYIVGALNDASSVERTNFEAHSAWAFTVVRFLQLHRVPEALVVRAHAYFDYLWQRTRGFHAGNASMKLLARLPPSLMADARGVLPERVLAVSELFEGLPEGFVALMLAKARSVICAPGEEVFRERDASDGVYFLCGGTAVVLVEDAGGSASVQVSTLYPGDTFGTFGVLLGKHRTATVQASTYCDLLRVGADDLREALVLFPSAREAVLDRTQQQRVFTKKQEATAGRAAGKWARMAGNTRQGPAASVADDNADPYSTVRSHAVASTNARGSARVAVVPGSAAHAAIQAVAGLAALYVLLAVPFELVFLYYAGLGSGDGAVRGAAALDALADLALVAVTASRFTTGFLEQGEVVLAAQLSRRRYLSSGFARNALALLPVDWAVWAVTGAPVHWWRLPRLLWAAELPGIADAVVRRAGKFRNHVRLAGLLSVVLAVAHMCACAYFASTHWGGYGGNDWRMPEFVETASVSMQYTRSLFLALSVLGSAGKVAPPERDSEIAHTLACILIGMFLVAYIVGGVAEVVTNLDAFRSRHDSDHRFVHEYLTSNGAPTPLLRRLRAYYDLQWERNRGVSPADAMRSLPRSLRVDVLLDVFGGAIRDAPVFASCPESFIQDLAAGADFRVFPAGEYVFRRGHVDDTLFVVVSGEVSLLLPVRIKDRTRARRSSIFGRSGSRRSLQTAEQAREAERRGSIGVQPHHASREAEVEMGHLGAESPAAPPSPAASSAAAAEPAAGIATAWGEPVEEASFMLLGRGGHFGETEVVDQPVRAVTARAHSSASLLAVPKRHVLACLDSSPEVKLALEEAFCSRLDLIRALSAKLAQPMARTEVMAGVCATLEEFGAAADDPDGDSPGAGASSSAARLRPPAASLMRGVGECYRRDSLAVARETG